jgi:hypothetical protein
LPLAVRVGAKATDMNAGAEVIDLVDVAGDASAPTLLPVASWMS